MALTYLDRGVSKSGTQWTVLAGPVIVGSISKTMLSIMSKDHERWHWMLNSHYGPPGYVQHGNADSLAEAQAELERNWTMWLNAVSG